MHQIFQGIWVPIITPFMAEEVDHAALAHIARHLAGQGIAGLVAGATTGEGASLSSREKIAVFETLRNTLGPNYPLVIGLCQSDTRAAVAEARALAQLGPTGLLVTTPPYLRPSQDGLRQHFEAVTEANDLPVLIYNIPYRSGVAVELETLQRLAQDPRIAGIKECGASVDRLMRLIHETPLHVMIGEDSQFFAALCMGAHGAIAAAAHLRPDLWVRIFDLLQAGQLPEARSLAARLQPLIRACFAEPNPAPVKALLAAQDLGGAELRLPITRASAACLEGGLAALARLQGL